MSLPYSATELKTGSSFHSAADGRLRGRWLIVAQLVWAAIVLLALGLFVAAVPALYLYRLTPPDSVREGLAQLGLSTGFYAGYWTVIHIVFALVYFLVAAVIAWRKPDEPPALFVSLFLVLLGGVNAATTDALLGLRPHLFVPVRLSFFLTVACLMLFFFLFPDGRFVPRWLRVPVCIWIAGLWFILLLAEFYPAAGSPSDWLGVMLAGGLTTAGIAQIYRYLRVSDQVQRQQTKWIVFGATAAVVGQLVAIFLEDIFPSLTRPGLLALIYDLINVTLIVLSFLLIPLSIGFAILRYRLWDIDLIINRTLVYGALTASVVGIYVLVVGGASAVLQTRGNLLVSLLATGVVAVLFQPLRDRLQRGINRLMYGERDDPYGVLSRLSQRLEATLAPDAVLPTLVETVKEALKLPYVAIVLHSKNQEPRTKNQERDTGSKIVAASGTPPAHLVTPSPAHLVTLPLTYQGEPVGRLLLAPRAPGEPFSTADRRLLENIAHQAGITLHAIRLHTHAIQLAADLQRSREHLVTAREEERRRLRRDLHDGLGPQLASLTLKLETVRNRLAHVPDTDAMFTDLIGRTQAAVADIRRLVYALRPPVLDEFGLVSALREVAAQNSRQELPIVVDVPTHLPPLPAAVEVAVYRIVQEALTNVVRHAEARTCMVRLSLDETAGMLCLEVRDDGRGLPTARATGVGLQSMRERAEELGGTFSIETIPTGGTCVRAWLPLGGGMPKT